METACRTQKITSSFAHSCRRDDRHRNQAHSEGRAPVRVRAEHFVKPSREDTLYPACTVGAISG